MHGIYVLVTLYKLLLVFTDLTLYDTSVKLHIGLVLKKILLLLFDFSGHKCYSIIKIFLHIYIYIYTSLMCRE